jgi:hypothetical protein
MPIDAITRTFGIVGQRGTGKSSTGVVLVEEMAAHAPFVVIDPTGAWFGLRTSRDGKRAGLDCVVLGGHEGDVALEPTGGQVVADLVVRDRYSLVLDLELMRKGQQIRFVADFLEALYHGSREATFVVIDEAHRFAPQLTGARKSGSGDIMRSIGAVEDVVKLGRRKGLGAAVISQRAASLNTEVLEQSETLIVHRLMGPNDRKAIANWFEAQGSPEDEKVALAALPRLARGEAYVMSPAFLRVFGEFKIRTKGTYDSSREPDVGEKITAPKGRADVDLEALTERMAATIERAKAEDPKELRKQLAAERKRIKTLEHDLEQRPAETKEIEVEKLVEVPVLANGVVDQLQEVVRAMLDAAQGIQGELAKVSGWKPPQRRPAERRTEAPRRRPSRADERPAGAAPPAAELDDDAELPPAALKFLQTLVRQHPMAMTRSQMVTLSGYSRKSSTVPAAMTVLRNRGLIVERGSQVEPSDAAFDLLGEEPQEPLSPDEVIEGWRQALRRTPAPLAFFEALVDAHPEGLVREELVERAGYSMSSSTVPAALTTLRRNGLIEEDGGEIRASSNLFVAVS